MNTKEILAAAIHGESAFNRAMDKCRRKLFDTGKCRSMTGILREIYEELYDTKEIPLQMRLDLCRAKNHLDYIRMCHTTKARLQDCIFLRAHFIQLLMEKAGIGNEN